MESGIFFPHNQTHDDHDKLSLHSPPKQAGRLQLQLTRLEENGK